MQSPSESILSNSCRKSGKLLTLWDKKTLYTPTGTGETRKVKHVAYHFSRMRCIAVLHEMPRMMFYILEILLFLILLFFGSASISHYLVFIYPRRFSLKTLSITWKPLNQFLLVLTLALQSSLRASMLS